MLTWGRVLMQESKLSSFIIVAQDTVFLTDNLNAPLPKKIVTFPDAREVLGVKTYTWTPKVWLYELCSPQGRREAWMAEHMVHWAWGSMNSPQGRTPHLPRENIALEFHFLNCFTACMWWPGSQPLGWQAVWGFAQDCSPSISHNWKWKQQHH